MIRRLEAPATRGLHRVTGSPRAGTNLGRRRRTRRGGRGGPGAGAGGGEPGGWRREEMLAFLGREQRSLVVPGKYTVSLAKRMEGVVTPVPGPKTVEVAAEGPASKEDRVAMADFQEKLSKLQKALTATTQTATEAGARLTAIRRAIDATPSLSPKLREDAIKLERQLNQITLALNGDRVWRATNEGDAASISEHVQAAASPTRGTTGRPTKTAMEHTRSRATHSPPRSRNSASFTRTTSKLSKSNSTPPGRLPGRLPNGRWQ